MCDMEKIYIDDKYLVRDKSSSDGSQIKYYYQGRWFKIDYFGGEAEAECLSSMILENTDLTEEKYVRYRKATVNDLPACVSNSFIIDENNEEFVTFYRLYMNIYGRDLALVTSKMDYDDAILYVIDFIKRETDLDVTTYLANTFWLDSIILNTDRHFNNYGIIMCKDGFREAPIFDNGKSLLTGERIDVGNLNVADRIKKVYSKSFSPSFEQNYRFLKDYCTIKLDIENLKSKISSCRDSLQKQVLEYQISKYNNIFQ